MFRHLCRLTLAVVVVLTTTLTLTSSTALAGSSSATGHHGWPVIVHVTVKGDQGTIFRGFVLTRGQTITTPSGGSHACDGTNNGANPHPGGTPTTALNKAALVGGFSWDADFFPTFDDFLITEIDGEAQDADSFWLVSVNGTALQVGGCQFVLSNFDHVTWELVDF